MPEYYTPSDFAAVIFSQRYSLNGEESWEEACKRVAGHIATAEVNGARTKWESRFTDALQSAKFIPGGRIWYGSGRPKGQLLNCFVVPTEDSREGWGKTVSDMLVISGTGGGVGMNFSPIRPRGTAIKGTGGEATGAVSLMEVINQTGEVIKSGGGRRTALMMCLSYNHGDLMEFLAKKFNKVELEDEAALEAAVTSAFPYLPQAEREAMMEIAFSEEIPEDADIIEAVLRPLIKHQKDQTLKNANISVLVDQHFFDAVENEEDIEVVWRGNTVTSYPAKEVWDMLVQNAWESGEPGILNIGLANEMNNIHYHKPLISTNPCGEIWLEAYGCCDLGAINLAQHINAEGTDFDWDDLNDSVNLGVRFLDNVLDVNTYPLAEIEKNCKDVRRIGLGVMGLGHALVKLGLRYDRSEGRKKVDQVFNFMKKKAYEASTYLSAEKGCFPSFKAEPFLESGFCQTLTQSLRSKIKEYGMRNCAVLTIAPTGTTSILAATSSGIEPIFAPGYQRTYYADAKGSNDRVLKTEVVIDPLFEELYRESGDMEQLASVFVGAMDIDVESHLRMQTICQKHIDNAVSKTINVPHDYPVETFGEMMLKYGPQLKGTTVYRSGSRGNEPLKPMTAQEAIDYLINKDDTMIGTAMSDCPSGICEIGEKAIVPEEAPTTE
jgi:ribonucleoside-diphosphate reductase alpha chain